MRIGITGANGFIGSHLLRSTVAKGHHPVAFLQAGTSDRPIAGLAGTYVSVWGDLLDPESVDRFVSQCDVIFHLAGFNRYWSGDRSVFTKVNCQGTQYMARACLKWKIEKLIHASSCITLGASPRPVSRNEDSEFNLHHIDFLYAKTKKEGEELIKAWTRKKGLPAVVVNPTSAIGEEDHGPTPIGKPIADIARGMWPVYVAGGACFIDVHEVVRALWLALEKGRVGEQYLLVGENMSNREFMSAVALAAGVNPPRLKVPKPVLGAVASVAELAADWVTRRPPPLTRGMNALIGKYLYFDGAKAEAELGFKAAPTRPAIERAVRWFRETEGARA